MKARQAQKIVLKSYMTLEAPKHKQTSVTKAIHLVSRKAARNTKAAQHIEFWDGLLVQIPRLAAELNLHIAS